MRAALILAALALAAPAPAWAAGESTAGQPAADKTATQKGADKTSGGKSVEELKAELAAQQQINALLKQRINTLEAELASTNGAAQPAPAAKPSPPPPAGPGTEEQQRALERALVRRGTAVLPPWKVEIAPGFAWTHTGSNSAHTRQDLYTGSLDARVGLPGGWMLGAVAPFGYRDVQGVGDNTGLGDVSLAVWKSLMVQNGTWPSIVASLQYTAPTGEDFTDSNVPIGSGFHQIAGSISALKTIDPIAFFGNVSYAHAFERSFNGAERQPGDTIGFGVGASLAVTPAISMTAAFNLSFVSDYQIDGSKIGGTSATLGTFQLGTGILLTRGVFLSLTGAVGMTDDTPDLSFGVSLPIRF